MFFSCIELRVGSFFEFPKTNILDSDTLQALHSISTCFDHAPNLAVFSFFQKNRKFSTRDPLDLTWTCLIASRMLVLSFTFFQRNHDSFSHRIEMGIIDRSEYLHDIFFFVFVSGMHEIIREAPVIREEDESRRLLIETTDRKDAFRNVDDIENPRVFMRHTRAHDTIRLVHLIVDQVLSILHDRIGNFYLVFFWIDDLSCMRRDSIDGDFSRCDILLGFSARADTSMREIFLELHR